MDLQRAPEKADAGLRAPLARPRVLVAHADKSVRQLVKLHLACAGYDVTVAGDAFEAANEMHRAPPDLIVLDAALGPLPALEFVAARGRAPQGSIVPVIFVASGRDMLERAIRLGAAALLTSELGAEKLLDLVGRILRGEHVYSRAGFRVPGLTAAA
jgi:twitching motility two-component system response regulator PilH